MNFATLKGLTIPEGAVMQITDASGRVLWNSIRPIGSLAVGSSVFLKVNGKRTEFLVVHQGNPNATLYDGFSDGTWLLMKDIYELKNGENPDAWNYKDSGIHTYLNSTFLNLFDSDVLSNIRQVKIPYSSGTPGNDTVISGSKGLSAKIFLLSFCELGWINDTYPLMPMEGTCLDYFRGTSTTDSKRIAYFNGEAEDWFIRTPAISSFNNNIYNLGMMYTSASGTFYGTYGNTNARGMRPALIVSPEMLVN